MNKKAFVLMETIVVIVVISVALLTIFTSYNKILSKVKTENKYDTSEYIYMTNYVKKFIKNSNCLNSIEDEKEIYQMGKDVSNSRNKELYNYFDKCNPDNKFNIKKIYLLQYLNEIDEDESDLDLYKFDAYMIDYLRKLDVGDNDTIIVVEYDRVALDDKGNEIYTSNCPYGNPGCESLTDTYIASLEWD